MPFAAIYLLLMVSLVGCIVPRLFVYWRGYRADPPPAPGAAVRQPELTDSAAWAAFASLRDPASKAFYDRKRAEGKTTKEAHRCLKRHLTRRIWHLLYTAETSAALELLGKPK